MTRIKVFGLSLYISLVGNCFNPYIEEGLQSCITQ
jgi:hypothetical protein